MRVCVCVVSCVLVSDASWACVQRYCLCSFRYTGCVFRSCAYDLRVRFTHVRVHVRRARPAAIPRPPRARREPAEAPESSSRGSASRESPIIDTHNFQERRKLNRPT